MNGLNLNAGQVRWCLMLGVAGLIGGTISGSSPAEWRWVSGLAIAAAAAAGFLAGKTAPTASSAVRTSRSPISRA